MGKRIALLGAMPQEVQTYKRLYENKFDVLVEASGVGKPAAAATTQRIISEWKPNALIFTGVAGALDPKLNIGDLVVGIAAIDSDIDVRNWDDSYKLGEIPFSRERVYLSDKKLSDWALKYQDSARILSANVPPTKTFDAYIA